MNRKKSVALLVSVAVASLLSAQTTTIRHQWGLVLGGNYSTLQSDLFSTNSGRLSPVLGCAFMLGFSDRFEANTEVVFTRPGAGAKVVRFRPEEQVEELNYAYHYNTFETSILLGFKPFKRGPLVVQAGGFFGAHFHNLSKDRRDLFIGDYTDIVRAKPATEINDAFAGFDLGPVFGLGIGGRTVRLHARYCPGMTNLYKHIPFTRENHHIRSGSFRLTISYFL